MLSTADMPAVPTSPSPSQVEDQQVLALCAPQDENTMNLDSIADNIFFDLFRMTRETFDYVIEEIEPFMLVDDEKLEVKVGE